MSREHKKQRDVRLKMHADFSTVKKLILMMVAHWSLIFSNKYEYKSA